MKIDFDDVKIKSIGRWVSIFQALGLDVDCSGKHGPCPMCGGGKDRFRFDDKEGRGTYFCSQCNPHSGDGFALVGKCLNVDFKGAIDAVAAVVGGCDRNEIPKEKTATPEYLRKIFTDSLPVREGDPVSRYLTGRGLVSLPDKLRYSPSCWEPETKRNYKSMLAVFSLPDGEAVTMHRTYLQNGEKAPVKKPKKVLPPLKKMAGGAIRLFDVENIVAVAEGIETAISVKDETGLPCWSTVSNTLMESFTPPDGIIEVHIFADNDKNYAGQKSAYILANRLSLSGISTSVYVPGKPGHDFLDEHAK